MDVLNLNLQRKKVSRVEAELQGLTLYWSGKPCMHNHQGWRYVSNGACRGCQINRTGVPRIEFYPGEALTARRRSVEDRREMREIELSLNGYD